MKSTRKYSPVTLTFDSQDELDMMWDISDQYKEIGKIMGNKFHKFLIEVNNTLSDDNIVGTTSSGYINEFPHIEDESFFPDGVKHDDGVAQEDREEFKLSDEQNAEMSEYLENRQLSKESRVLKDSLRGVLVDIEEYASNKLSEIYGTEDIGEDQEQTALRALNKSEFFQRLSVLCESVDYARYEDEQSQELQRRIDDFDPVTSKTYTMEEVLKRHDEKNDPLKISRDDTLTYGQLVEDRDISAHNELFSSIRKTIDGIEDGG